MIAIVAGVTLSTRVGCMEMRVLLSQELSDRPTQGHQQIKETPTINYNAVRRIITGWQDYNPPVRIITDYTTIPVSRSLWNGNKIIYYSSKLHSFSLFVRNILPYQFRNPYGVVL